MAVLRIVTYPQNPVLLRKARPVPRVTRRAQRLVRDMLETMYAAPGVGLAAPQVNAGQRVIVVDVSEGPIVLVNPEIAEAEGEQVGLESCLSVPDLAGEVRRAERVTVRGLDRGGEPVTVQGEGLLARALQHEVDHLDGILFIARLTAPDRLWRASELEQGEEAPI